MRFETSRRLRYAPPLAIDPIHMAMLLVTFEGIAGTPVKSKAGNPMKLPPPATEFRAAANSPAKKISVDW